MLKINKTGCCLLFAGLFLIKVQRSFAQQIHFKHDFAPTDAFVKPQEKPFRDGICLNGEWQFMPVEKADKLGLDKIKNPTLPENPAWENTPVKVPSPWNVNSFAMGDGSGGNFLTYPSYPKKWEGIKAGWLMRSIPYRKEWKGKHLILHFDAVGGYTQIYMNKHKVGENFEVFLPFEVDVTNAIKPGQDNELLMWVADAQLFNQPGKYGRRIHVAGSFWGQHAIGIWQDVNLIAKPYVNIQNTFVKPSVSADELTVEATISNTSDKTQEISITSSISPWVNLAGKDVVSAPEPKWELGDNVIALAGNKIRIAANSQATVSMKIKVSGRLKEWSTENPNLYGLILTAKDGNTAIDKQFTRFGWREFTLSGNKLLLNGKPIVLKGDSWHFMGIPQMTRRYAWAWFKLLQDSHANAVRLHAQPYPQFYLDMADEMGICVLDETGMWASDGGPKVDAEAYWQNSEEHLKRFIMRDRNHPAVFGWSVCNENLPVVSGVFHAPDSLVKRQVAEIDKWIAITRELDPSRAWISGDGETQANINSPVIVGHYGGSDENYKNLSSKGKPWGIGEAGMAYYATPHQTAQYNGDRSYQSQQGRMEGVADEATKLINMLKKYNASYMSIFNLVWYGVKPLELGLADTTKAPKASNGIFFGKYKPDYPGVQPERLGPYTTTLNPGYDPALPLYKSWPLLDAVKASFASEDIIKENPAPVANPSVNNHPAFANTVLLLSTDKDSTLYKTLSEMGVSVSANPNKNGHNLLIIDGQHTPGEAKSIALKKTILQSGGNILVWGINPASVQAVNQYLPKPIELTNRKATSFLTKDKDQLTNGLSDGDFYFSEIADKPMMTYGLTGELVKQSHVLLDASNTDWKTWNKRAEYLKTAAVLRSEREYKPEGKALISVNEDKGKLYVFAIDPALLSATSVSLVRKMLVNLGVDFSGKGSKDMAALSADGKLTSALLLASFDIQGKSDSEISKLDLLKNNKTEDYFAGKQVANHFWEKTTVTDGVFDFSKLHFDGPATNAIAYLSFWIYSPRSLSNLLLEPDMPRLDMYIGADDGYQVFLNNIMIKENINSGGFASRGQAIKALPLEKGWNHFVIKAIQKAGGWKLAVEFDCDKKSFMTEVKTQVAH
ncbi:MAG: glycoside hydrolase family 2 TIM barrel-domain containing protein [Bacteroidota bacterium]